MEFLPQRTQKPGPSSRRNHWEARMGNHELTLAATFSAAGVRRFGVIGVIRGHWSGRVQELMADR
jgi:hypothetical protein